MCEEKRGICKAEDFMSNGKTIHLTYEIPLTEMISDFFDTLKSLSQGYASLDYEHARFQVADIKKVVFALNNENVDALTFLVHESRVISFSRNYAKRLKEILPAQLY